MSYSQRGAGTKILNHPFVDRDTTTLTEYVGLSTEMRKANRPLTSEVIDFQVAFPEQGDPRKTDADRRTTRL